MAGTLDMGYDIIGDVHGFIDELEILLGTLGYQYKDSVWQHPHRKAVFTGDFICRGPNSKAVLDLIRNMVEAGFAQAILGNHELNAILYFTKSKEKPLHEPSKSNKQVLLRFAAEYGRQTELLDGDIRWMRTLPLFLDYGDFRVVHAYWNASHIEVLAQLHEDGRIRKSRLKEIAAKKGLFAQAVHEATRGIEFILPHDLLLKDSKNIMRNSFRIKWWLPMNGRSFNEMCFGSRFALPHYTIPDQIVKPYDVYGPDEPIVFIGHYCMGNQMIQTPNICCVDACVAAGGHLGAYRYDGETQLMQEKLVLVKK